MSKKLVLLFLVVLMALPIAGFAAPKGLVIGLTLPSVQYPFFVTMKDDFDQLAAKLGVTVVYIDAQNNSANQVAAI